MKQTAVISIETATYHEPYFITFRFSDGLVRTIDLGPFLRTAKNPMTKKYPDTKLFKNFAIENGDIIWNDYELCFPKYQLSGAWPRRINHEYRIIYEVLEKDGNAVLEVQSLRGHYKW